MREGKRLAGKFRYKLIFHSLIRPRIKYGAGSTGTFSRWEKEDQHQSAPAALAVPAASTRDCSRPTTSTLGSFHGPVTR